MKARTIAAAITFTSAIALACEHPPTSPALQSANPQIDATVWRNAFNLFEPLPPYSHFIPCAAGGAGEIVDFTGRIHLVVHQIVTPSGPVTHQALLQIQWMKGIGRTTGDTYQGSSLDATAMTYQQPNDHLQAQDVWHIHYVGPGPGNDFFEWETLQFHVNANGVVTVNVLKESTDCK